MLITFNKFEKSSKNSIQNITPARAQRRKCMITLWSHLKNRFVSAPLFSLLVHFGRVFRGLHLNN